MTIKHFLSIVEIRTKVVSIGTFISAMAYLFWLGTDFNWGAAFLMFLAVLCVDMGTTAFNSYFDFLSGVDNHKYNKEKNKVLLHEGVDPSQAFYTAFILFVIAVVMGFILAFWRGWMLIPAGALSMAVGFFYTGGPRPISTTPFGEIAAGGFLGSVLFILVCYVQTGVFTLSCFVASLPVFITIAQILTVNNTCDRKNDEEAGRKTLSILIGFKASRVLIALESFSAAGVIMLASVSGVITYFQLFGIIPFLLIVVFGLVTLYRKGLTSETKDFSMGIISSLFLQFTVIYSLMFFLAAVFQ
jgi:1,4-dihydroxy-2-naphthoate polyprenyltransferase